MAYFELGPHQVSKAVTHRTVEQIWYFVSGQGQMWRQQNQRSEIVDVKPGVAITIPPGTHFQFRSTIPEPLAAIGITMPPSSAADEAVLIPGPWLNTMP
jgi:mannose-6-phosphate isomerase-like protein (cupin superfamily)